MVAAESLFQGWDAGNQRYREVPLNDREWLLGQLKTIHQRDGIEILAIDYAPAHDRQLARETAAKITALGFTPWVTDAGIDSIGIGRIEVVPRRVLVVYNDAESPALNYSNAHRYLQMPLNHMGYIVDYADVNKELPKAIHGDRYAGVVTYFTGATPAQRQPTLTAWLGDLVERKMPLAIIGDLGFAPDRAFAGRLGLRIPNVTPRPPLSINQQHAMLGFESAPLPNRSNLPIFQAGHASAETLLELRDSNRQQYLAGAILPWGGFILNPFALVQIPATDLARWVIDPFAFLQAALRLPAIPVPDVTTENGRRLFFSHIDGDGFPSIAELPGNPIAAQVMLSEILQKYRIPTTVSVIEAEVAPHGLHPKLSPSLEQIAQQIFRLPHVEIASHTFAHPFIWDPNVTGLELNQNRLEGNYHLNLPGYTFDPHREIVGSTQYINDRLAPPGKQVKVLLWSGDTAPDANALRIVETAGLLNMNGGDTSITRQNPSLTAVGALGIEKGGYLQVYAPITNENIHTNLWRGPFYGYERVIESFEMTGTPRRLKPVGIYYHTYSASKRAGLNALHKVFAWALAQPLHPVFASEYIRKVRDFHDIAIARDNGGWRINGNGDLRTLRWPGSPPRLQDAAGIAGYRPDQEGHYLHLTGPKAWFNISDQRSTQPFLYEANARITGWQNNLSNFALQGHVPLEFSLANSQKCKVRADGRLLTPSQTTRVNDTLTLQTFKHSHAAAQIHIVCAPG